jgi:hypothetical protein
LYIALVASAILLLVVNLIAWKAEHPVAPILATAFLIGLASTMICIFLPPVILQAALMCIVASIWGATVYRPWFFHLLSCAATLVAFGVPGYFALRETRNLQEAFPYVSMDERLPPAKNHRPARALPTATADRLREIEDKYRDLSHKYRESAFRQIHEDTVRIFVNRPGFGVTRMIPVSEERLKHEEPPIPQPGTPSASPWLPEELSRKQPAESKTLDNLLSLHRESIVDFVNFAGFGYIKDRQHVAGFQEHQVSQTPTPERPWTLQTLDLVGLLLHEKTIAYVSKDLPRMKELRAAPTRELDDFETAGLLALQRGDDLFVRERGPERRMLGAIRAARQCLSCHEAERGDLLGAFSYRMTQDGR